MILVLDNLSLGDAGEAMQPPAGVTALLAVGGEQPVSDSTLLNHWIPMRETRAIQARQLAEAVDWIDAAAAAHRVMIVSQFGVAAPSAVIAYLCCVRGFRFADAIEHVVARKPNVSISPNLLTAIRIVSRYLRGEGNLDDPPMDKATAMRAQRIVDNLTIGSHHDASRPPVGVTALLCVALETALIESGLQSHKVPIEDEKPVCVSELQEAVEWLLAHAVNHHVMVYCHGGVGRSSSVVIAYLCCALRYGFGDAVEFVARRKPYMSFMPNLMPAIAEVQRRLERKNRSAHSPAT